MSREDDPPIADTGPLRSQSSAEDDESSGRSGPSGSVSNALFESQIADCVPRLRNYIAANLPPLAVQRLDTSDVMQEVLAEAWKHRDKAPDQRESDRGSQTYLWLRSIAQHRMVDLHRRLTAAKRDVRREARPTAISAAAQRSLAEMLVDSITSPSERAGRQEEKERLIGRLQALAPADQEILLLRHFEQVSNQEAAHILKLSEAAAANRYVRALERLKTLLARHAE